MMATWLKAKRETPCALCHQTIALGDRMLPYGANSEHSFCYMHLVCAKQSGQTHAAAGGGGGVVEVPVCKHWRSRGFCLFGERCAFRHPPELAAAPAQQAALRAARAAPSASSAPRGGAGGRPRGYAQRNKVKNRFRAGAFRRWLIDTYGRERLKEGAGVLDVAGGKGELAFELANLNGIPATVVEPRELDLAQRTKWLQRGYYHWNPVFAKYIDRHFTSKSLEWGAAAPAAASSSGGGAAVAAAAAAGAAAASSSGGGTAAAAAAAAEAAAASSSGGGTAAAAEAAAASSSGGGTAAARDAEGAVMAQAVAAGPSGSQGSGSGGQASCGGEAGVGTVVMPRHLRLVITHEVCQQLGLGTQGVPEENDGGGGEWSDAPGAAGDGGAAPAPAPGPGLGTALSMPPGWPAALRAAREQAQQSRWTKKGLVDHESAAAAAEAAGKPPKPPRQERRLAAAAARAAEAASRAAAGGPAGAAGAAAGSGKGAAGSGGGADVGQFLNELFARIEGPSPASPGPCPAPMAEARPPGAPDGRGGSMQPAPSSLPLPGPEEDGWTSLAPGQLASAGALLDGLFSQLGLAEPPAVAGATPAEPPQPEAHAAVLAAGSSGAAAAGLRPAAAAPAPLAAGPAGDGDEAEGSSGPSRAEVASFLDDLFSRIDAGLGAPNPPVAAAPEAAGAAAAAAPDALGTAAPPLPAAAVAAAAAEAAHAAAAPDPAQPAGPASAARSSAAGSTQAVQTAVAAPELGAGIMGSREGDGASFLDSLFARIDAAAGAGEPSVPAQGSAAPPDARHPPAVPSAARQESGASSAGAAGAAGSAGQNAAASGEAGCRGWTGPGGVGGFLDDLFGRMEVGAVGAAGAAGAAGDGSDALGQLGGEQPPAGPAAAGSVEGVAGVAEEPGAASGAAGAGAAANVGGSTEVTDPEEAWRLLTSASIIVGMHPDQATEFIVDLALRTGRSFAVVPCCVYPSAFPKRKLAGRLVTQYDQLVDYLIAKAPDRIRVAELPFEGKNKVVYCL